MIAAMPNAADTASRDQANSSRQRLEEDAEGVDEQRREADEDADGRRGGDAPALVAQGCLRRRGRVRTPISILCRRAPSAERERRAPTRALERRTPNAERLEDQLHRELQQPRRARGERCGRSSPSSGRATGRPKFGVVGDVERFGAELQPRAGRQREGAHQRDVDVGVGRAARDVAAGVAELAGLRQRVQALERVDG